MAMPKFSQPGRSPRPRCGARLLHRDRRAPAGNRPDGARPGEWPARVGRWPRPNSTVHFVADGIESAVIQARAAAAGKSVGVHSADTIQQRLNAGLLDEIHVEIAAVLLGSGVRLFDHLAGTPAALGNPTVILGVGVTHPRFPVREAQ
jgi:hypothetical protein